MEKNLTMQMVDAAELVHIEGGFWSILARIGITLLLRLEHD